MTVVAVACQKGGVGKTQISFNLAKGLSRKGFSVIAIDNDPQGNLTSAFLEDPSKLKSNILNIYQEEYALEPENIEGVDFLGADFHLSGISDNNDLENMFRLGEYLNQTKPHDFTIIDCNPSLNNLSMAALIASEYVVVPIKAAPWAIEGLTVLLKTINTVKKRFNRSLKVIGIVINFVEGKQTNMGEELERTLRETYKELVFKTTISKSIKLEESPAFNKSIMEYDPKGKQTQQFEKFIDEFLGRVKS